MKDERAYLLHAIEGERSAPISDLSVPIGRTVPGWPGSLYLPAQLGSLPGHPAPGRGLVCRTAPRIPVAQPTLSVNVPSSRLWSNREGPGLESSPGNPEGDISDSKK